MIDDAGYTWGAAIIQRAYITLGQIVKVWKTHKMERLIKVKWNEDKQEDMKGSQTEWNELA